MATGSNPTKTRILVLHGFYDSAQNREHQMRSLIRQMKQIEFVFIDAPFPFVNHGFVQSTENLPIEPRYQWMSYRPEFARTEFEYDTIKESVEYIIDYINQNGPFDGLLGFSQGAVVCVTMLLKIPTWPLLPSCIKFVILVGCPPLADPKIKSFTANFCKQDSLPTLHISGRNDTLIPTESSEIVFQYFNPLQAEFYVHNGGHFCPGDGDSRQKLREFLQRVLHS